MELVNEFRVAISVDQAWQILTDVERIAPCMPGAQLQEVEGDEYRGVVKVKVGPITAQYKGTATFVEQDAGSHRAVLRAEGRDTRGQGNASATVTATMEPAGDGTAVKVMTELTITGKVAQFGRGVLAEVSGKLIDQFVENLERNVLSGRPEVAEPLPEPASSGPVASPPSQQPAAPVRSVGSSASSGANGSSPAARRIEGPEAAPIDLLAAAGSPLRKRALPMGAVIAALLILLALRRRRRLS